MVDLKNGLNKYLVEIANVDVSGDFVLERSVVNDYLTKIETAINIGYSCKVLQRSTEIHIID